MKGYFHTKKEKQQENQLYPNTLKVQSTQNKYYLQLFSVIEIILMKLIGQNQRNLKFESQAAIFSSSETDEKMIAKY